MGRKSRLKKQYSPRAKKAINELLREAAPQPYSKNINGKVSVQYYNPLKKLMKQQSYSSEEGKEITKDMAEKYMNFLKYKMDITKNKMKEDTEQPIEEEKTEE